MRSGRRAWGFVVSIVVGLATLVLVLELRERPRSGNGLGLRRFATPGVSDGWQIGQGFRMNADGLTAVEVRTTAVGLVRGRVRFELRLDDDPARPAIRSGEVEAASLVQGDSYRFDFAPVADSRNAQYRFDLSSSQEEPSRGVALWATRGDSYPDGALVVNGTERWADLAFRTYSRTPPPHWVSPWLERAQQGRVQLALGALALSWVLLGRVLRRLVHHDDLGGVNRQG